MQHCTLVNHGTLSLTGLTTTGGAGATLPGSNQAGTTRGTGTKDTRYLVQGNTIKHYGETGIVVNARQGNSILDATIFGNTINEPGTAAGGAFAAIWVNAGALAADSNTVNIVIGDASVMANKNTMQDSDPNNVDDVFLDKNSCGGCASTLTLYRNGSVAGGSGEALVRQILVDDNNPTLDLLAGFTNGSTIGIQSGVPSVPPLLFAPGGVQAASESTFVGAVSVPSLTQVQLDAMTAVALQRWSSIGPSASQVAVLKTIKFHVQELAGEHVAASSNRDVTLSGTAAGHGWYVDANPLDDNEFGDVKSATRLVADPHGAPAGKLDLLTAIMHEMGHQLGFEDTYDEADRDSLMYGRLTLGEHRLPQPTGTLVRDSPSRSMP